MLTAVEIDEKAFFDNGIFVLSGSACAEEAVVVLVEDAVAGRYV